LNRNSGLLFSVCIGITLAIHAERTLSSVPFGFLDKISGQAALPALQSLAEGIRPTAYFRLSSTVER
jgi:hypothetical protein